MDVSMKLIFPSLMFHLHKYYPIHFTRSIMHYVIKLKNHWILVKRIVDMYLNWCNFMKTKRSHSLFHFQGWMLKSHSRTSLFWRLFSNNQNSMGNSNRFFLFQILRIQATLRGLNNTFLALVSLSNCTYYKSSISIIFL